MSLVYWVAHSSQRAAAKIYLIAVGHPQQTRYIDPMFDQCWADIVEDGPTLGRCVMFAGSPFKTRYHGYDLLPLHGTLGQTLVKVGPEYKILVEY